MNERDLKGRRSARAPKAKSAAKLEAAPTWAAEVRNGGVRITVVGSPQTVIAHVDGDESHEANLANAERLVACANAAAKGRAEGWEWAPRVSAQRSAKLEAENARLRAALSTIAKLGASSEDTDATDMRNLARAALDSK